MSAINPVYLTEDPTHDAIIQTINDEAFGPGRHARAAERVREQGPHDRSLSFVATVEGEVIASVRMTPIIAGSVNGHMLGPLAVRPDFKNFSASAANWCGSRSWRRKRKAARPSS